MRLTSEPTVTRPPVSGISWLNPSPSDDRLLRLTHELRGSVGEDDRIDRPVQVRRVAGEDELREQARVERVVAVARRVARAAGHLRGRSLLLRTLDGLLQRERRRRRRLGQHAGREEQERDEE